METRMQGGSAARSLTRLGDDRHWNVRDVPSLPVPLADDLPLARGFPLSGLPATAPIETREGYVSASQVHAGMSVRCLRGKWQTVRAAVALRHVLLPGDRSPVIIRKLALGSGPHVDLALPADQQVIIDSPRAVQVAGQRQVAVQVGDLVHLDHVLSLAPVQGVFVHLLLDTVDAVRVGDLWLATTHPDQAVLNALGSVGRRALFSAVPRLAHAAGQARYLAAWPMLSTVEAQEVL
jgi:hypothetical protein